MLTDCAKCGHNLTRHHSGPEGGWCDVESDVNSYCKCKGFVDSEQHLPGDIEHVHHPAHYNAGRIEVIDFIDDQALDFYQATVVKYICRMYRKGHPLQDAKKALWYLTRYVAILEGKEVGKQEESTADKGASSTEVRSSQDRERGKANP